MTNRDFDDRDIERLLSGQASESLADTAEAIAQLRSLDVAPAQGEAERAGAMLASVAAAAATEAPQAAPARRSKTRVRTAVAGGAALLIAGLVGGTAAADSAAPGDALYSLDRAIERIGLGAGGVPERIAEARKAEEDGDTETAIELVDEAVAEVLGDEAVEDEQADATEETAEETTEDSADEATEDAGTGSEVSEKVHECLRDIFAWMESTDLEGRDFGQGVAERHRNLHVAWQADSEKWQERHGDKVKKDKTAKDEALVEDEPADDEATESETSEPDTTTKPHRTSPQGDDATTGRGDTATEREQGNGNGNGWKDRGSDRDADDRGSSQRGSSQPGSSRTGGSHGFGYGAR
ncbi:hypothetical protein [Demequina maris]|uniref:hypothetical protein n=1 Tax=Demequina maris TaxID=1638982 RepID=UPI000784B215|nr:hypothetical protein [Demequina maris]